MFLLSACVPLNSTYTGWYQVDKDQRCFISPKKIYIKIVDGADALAAQVKVYVHYNKEDVQLVLDWTRGEKQKSERSTSDLFGIVSSVDYKSVKYTQKRNSVTTTKKKTSFALAASVIPGYYVDLNKVTLEAINENQLFFTSQIVSREFIAGVPVPKIKTPTRCLLTRISSF